MIPEDKIPYLPHKDIEHAATMLLRDFAEWAGSVPRPPINVDSILEGYLGLDLAVDNLVAKLGRSDVLGATFVDEKRVVVEQSLEGEEGRMVFTLGHEVGHWQLHRRIVEREMALLPLVALGNERPKPAILCRSGEPHRAEFQANAFAACLLMPAPDVRAAVKALHGDKLPSWEHVEERRRAHEYDPQLNALARAVKDQGRFTNVSNESMRIRLLELKLVRDASDPQGSLFG